MIGRPDREDTSRQENALADAYADLREALAIMSDDAAMQSRAADRGSRGKSAAVDVTALRAAWNQVERALEAVDVATYDLQGARGEHL